MSTTRFITLAIHTYPKALTLKKILESHGIHVRFENLIISGAGIASGVRVKIQETNLPIALKITESGDSLQSGMVDVKMDGSHAVVLIPVDFSPSSLLACKAGFEIARKLKLHPVLLHAYISPYFAGSLSADDPSDSGLSPIVGESVMEVEESIDMRRESNLRMKDFRRKLDSQLKDAGLDGMDYSVSVCEGIPEDTIKEYCRMTPPTLVVMATRDVEKKGEQLVGSVTAEVLDSCRVPVFTIPENFRFTSVDSLKRLVYFCNLDQHDILSMDILMRTFSYPEVDVTLIPVNDRAGGDVKEKVGRLCDYFNKSYPTARFSTEVFPSKTFREDFEKFEKNAGLQLMIVPNKKRNVFSRLFNPGIAHKMLFERDLPLLALPV
ncbi:MAG: universal stress protein [Muribaculaceae bacterium]